MVANYEALKKEALEEGYSLEFINWILDET